MKASPSTRRDNQRRSHPHTPAVQRLTRFYVMGLGIVALVAVLGLAWNQAALRRQAQGARMLALAGRQRVLGQQIALDALAVQAADTPALRSARAAALEGAADEWEGNQQSFSGHVGPPVARLLGEAAPSGRDALADARELLAALPPDGSPQRPDLYPYLTPLLRSEALYAAGMEDVLAAGGGEAHRQSASLARTAWGLLVLTLLTLGAEAALVFGPSWGVVRRTVVSLQESEDKITGLDAALGEADRQIGEMRTVLENLSTVDALTGLKNHREFHEQLDRELGRALRHGHALSLMLVDVDKFKSYNDTYGHPDGDEALKLIARALKENARGSDIPARYGGEEFAVILTETDAMGALVLGERVRHAVADGDCLQRPLTVSVGIATLTPNMFGVAELIAQADRALCHAKGEGRNRVTHASRLPEPVEENWRFLPDGELVAA